MAHLLLVTVSSLYDCRDGQTSEGLAPMLRRTEELRAPRSTLMTKQFSPIPDIHAARFSGISRIVVGLRASSSFGDAACFVGDIISPLVLVNLPPATARVKT